MCTIGVLRFGDGDYGLFKNKDFARSLFDDQVTLEPSVFGVSGLATWAGSDPSLDEFSGFSIGASSHGLLCCDANVRTVPVTRTTTISSRSLSEATLASSAPLRPLPMRSRDIRTTGGTSC